MDETPLDVSGYSMRLTLMHMFKVLGYGGEPAIGADLLAQNGQAAWDYLQDNSKVWDAVVRKDKRWKVVNQEQRPP